MTKQDITLIILALIAFFALQWQINKIDRKLTCIYNAVNALPFFLSQDLRDDQSLLEKQIELTSRACDKLYIFTGIPQN